MRRVLGWIVAAPVILVVLAALLHVFIRPIPPSQQSPRGHYSQPCWMCHFVSTDAEPAEVD